MMRGTNVMVRCGGRWRSLRTVALAGVLAAASGCGALRQGAAGLMAPVAESLGVALQRQDDLVLVHDGLPAFLLLLDGLVLSAPDNAGLRLAASDAYSAYATAFGEPDDKARTAALFARARDHGLEVLSRNRRFKAALHRPLPEFEAAVRRFGRRDVPALYATATAWAGWIVSQPESMDAIAQLPRALALMARVMELERGYRAGGADTFYGIYCSIQPRGGGQDLPRAREHFERAMAYAGPDGLLPRVAFAEFYARYAFDRELFEKTLREVIEHRETNPDLALANAVARRRAESLLARADDWF